MKKNLMNEEKEKIAHRWNILVEKPWEYLTQIGFTKKLEEGKGFTLEEIKNILNGTFQKYVNGDVTQEFVLGVGSIIHNNVFMGLQIRGFANQIEKIASVACLLDDLAIAFATSKSTKTPEEIDQIIRELLKTSKKD